MSTDSVSNVGFLNSSHYALGSASGVQPMSHEEAMSSGLGGGAGMAGTLDTAVAAADRMKVWGWMLGKQAYPVEQGVLKDVNYAVNTATSDPTQRAWLMAHITGESTDLKGAANGDGKGGNAYNVSPYNINIHMVQEAAREAIGHGDPYGIGGFANASDASIKNISTLDASRVMLASLDMWGFNKTEAFVRAGGTGFLAMDALEKGGMSAQQAAAQWQSVDDGKFADQDMAQWLRGTAQRTAAILLDSSMATGQVQARNPKNGI